MRKRKNSKTSPGRRLACPYVRDGVPGLPMERQEEMLSAIGLDLGRKIYRDELSRAKIRAGSLPERPGDQSAEPRRDGLCGELAGARLGQSQAIRAMRTVAQKRPDSLRRHRRDVFSRDGGRILSSHAQNRRRRAVWIRQASRLELHKRRVEGAGDCRRALGAT
jgi:hypothetical protein